MTPTDIECALGLGIEILKFFPAGASGGVPMLKSLAGPYAHLGVKFIPTGGINAQNLGNYLNLPMVHACGGSWMVTKQLITAGEFDQITALVREAVAVVQQIKQGVSS